ncbi:MAG: alpha/beta hydrolase [Pseudomonadota bacterium]
MSGRQWVFLRGLMREERHWGDFPQVFRDTVGNDEVLTLDLPGNGSLRHEPSPLRVEEMAEWLRAELPRRGLKPPYHFLANSLGAMVAVAYAAAHPQELSGVVLINTSLRPYSAFWQRLRPAAWPTILRMAFTAPSARHVETSILNLISAEPARTSKALEKWIAWREEAPVSRANGLRQLIAGARFRAPVETPSVPILLLVGGSDRLVDPRCSKRVAQAWGSALAEHPGAGHDLPLDDGQWVAQQVRDWLTPTS